MVTQKKQQPNAHRKMPCWVSSAESRGAVTICLVGRSTGRLLASPSDKVHYSECSSVLRGITVFAGIT